MGGCQSSNTVVGDLIYSVQVGEPQSNATRTLRHPMAENGLVTTPHPDHTTIFKAFDYSFAKFAHKNCIGTRERTSDGVGRYIWKTYGEVKELATAFGSGVRGLCPTFTVDNDNFTFIGINAKNREEWLITDLSCILYRMTSVPFYDTLGPETNTYILKQTELEVLVCSGDIAKKIKHLKKQGQAGNLKYVITMDKSDKHFEKLGKYGITGFTFDQIIEKGRGHTLPYEQCEPNDVYTFSYTSGTTGDPKGAMLTHLNLMSTLAAARNEFELNSEDTHLSYLPMPHIFEKLMIVSALYGGAQIGFY
jgi:long-chain acyl-CoA synthetase